MVSWDVPVLAKFLIAMVLTFYRRSVFTRAAFLASVAVISLPLVLQAQALSPPPPEQAAGAAPAIDRYILYLPGITAGQSEAEPSETAPTDARRAPPPVGMIPLPVGLSRARRIAPRVRYTVGGIVVGAAFATTLVLVGCGNDCVGEFEVLVPFGAIAGGVAGYLLGTAIDPARR